MQYIVYQLINGSEIVSGVTKDGRDTILVNPMKINISINNSGMVDVNLFPYTIFSNRIKEFSDNHILSAVPAPPDLISIYQNMIKVYYSENADSLTVPSGTIFH